MVQSTLSSSPLTVPPRSLAERIAAEIPKPPPGPEPTVSSMAERFAPEAPKARLDTLRSEAFRRPSLNPTIVPEPIFEPRSSGFGTRWLFAGLFGAALIPVALLLMFASYGAPRFAVPQQTAVAVAEIEPAAPPAQTEVPLAPAAQQASTLVGFSTSEPVAETKPDLALTAPAVLEAKAGDEVPFAISIDSSDNLPDRSVIAISALPDGATFSQGRPYGANQWSLGTDEIGDLKLRLPSSATGDAHLRIELSAADGSILATATTKLAVAPQQKSALILRVDERDRITDLIGHGNKMISVGYFAGARAYFRRAAEAGSAEAALMVGATYDQAFIDALQIEGIHAEPDAAEEWYDRATALGLKDQSAALAALKQEWTKPVEAAPTQTVAAAPTEPAQIETQTQTQTQTASLEPSRLGPSSAKTGASAETSGGQSTLGRLMQATGLSDGGEWVVISGAVNIRAEPSSSAQALRVVEKGAKLRVTDRKGNWVQVTDPATSETGWVYSRFIATADSASR